MIKKISLLIIILVFAAFYACGDEETGNEAGTGSITFSLKMPDTPVSLKVSSKVYQAPIDCAATGISTINADVFNSSDAKIASGGPWACTAHGGSITGVPAGSGYKVVVNGKDVSGAVLYQGISTGLSVVPGQSTNAGTITFADVPLSSLTWTKHASNPVLAVGTGGSWDDTAVRTPTVIKDGSTYHMWYHGEDGTNARIGYATSTDGISWTKSASNPVLDLGAVGDWDDTALLGPTVLKIGPTDYRMWYVGDDGTNRRIGYATSTDGVNWIKYASNPVLDLGAGGSWEEYLVVAPTVLYDGSSFQMWYHGADGSNPRIGYATSGDGVTWFKHANNPVLDLGEGGSWDDSGLLAPSVIKDGSSYYMWYGGDDGTNRRIGFAYSSDGINWTKNANNPVLDIGSGGSWEDSGLNAPTVLYDGITYQMWYIGNNQIGYATADTGKVFTSITSGLVAYYPFNGNADDKSGNANNGTVSGATLTEDRFGNPNSAYSFDGVDDYIDVANDPSLNNHTEMTLTAWVKTSAHDADPGFIFAKTAFDENQYNLSIYPSKYAQAAAWYAIGAGHLVPTTADPVNDGQWHFIAGVLKNNVSGEIYLDGVLSGTDTPSGYAWNLSGPGPLTIGKYLYAGVSNWIFNGLIDDIQIYNRALSVAEIQTLYTEGTEGTDAWTTKTPMPTTRGWPTSSLVNGKIYVIGGNDGGNLTTVEEYDPVTDTWTNCGGSCANMPTARYSLTSNVVNGKIYIIGGNDGSYLTTVEEYDPVTNTWTNCGGSCANMPTARDHLSSSVVNGKIYVLGGYNGSYLNTVEEYDPATNTWTNCGGSCTNMPTTRQSLTSSVVNGKIYVIGGNDGVNLTTVEEYDPVTNTWTNCGSSCANIPTVRHTLTSSVVNGKIYVIGGYGDGAYLTTVEEYDPITNTWTNCGGSCVNMPTARYGHTNSVVNGKIYVIGGYDGVNLNTVEEYDPNTSGTGILNDTWTTKTPMPTKRYMPACGAVNGKVYVIGGNHNVMYNIVEEYSPVFDTWSTKTPMPTQREGASGSVVNGKVYVIGGNNYASGVLSVVEEYDPASDSWATKSSMPTARLVSTSSVVDGKIYIIGGQDTGGITSAEVEEYDPATDTWASKTPSPVTLKYHGSTVFNGKIYVIGGSDGTSSTSAVYEYDPQADTWATRASMPTERYTLSADNVNGKIYAIGGWSPSTSEFVDIVEEYDPVTNTWTTKTSKTYQQGSHCSSVVNGSIYTFGGRLPPSSTYNQTNIVEAYGPAP